MSALPLWDKRSRIDSEEITAPFSGLSRRSDANRKRRIQRLLAKKERELRMEPWLRSRLEKALAIGSLDGAQVRDKYVLSVRVSVVGDQNIAAQRISILRTDSWEEYCAAVEYALELRCGQRELFAGTDS